MVETCKFKRIAMIGVRVSLLGTEYLPVQELNFSRDILRCYGERRSAKLLSSDKVYRKNRAHFWRIQRWLNFRIERSYSQRGAFTVSIAFIFAFLSMKRSFLHFLHSFSFARSKLFHDKRFMGSHSHHISSLMLYIIYSYYIVTKCTYFIMYMYIKCVLKAWLFFGKLFLSIWHVISQIWI